jgi:hypothetical protein
MNKKDEQKFGLYIFLGFAFGGILGMALGAVSGNIFNGFWMGALIGVFLGWFIAAAVFQNISSNK